MGVGMGNAGREPKPPRVFCLARKLQHPGAKVVAQASSPGSMVFALSALDVDGGRWGEQGRLECSLEVWGVNRTGFSQVIGDVG